MAGQGIFQVFTIDKIGVRYMIPKTVFDKFILNSKTEWHFSTDDPSGENIMQLPEMKIVRTDKKLRFKIHILFPHDSTDYFEFGDFVISHESKLSIEERTLIGEKIDDSGACYINVNNEVFYNPLITTNLPATFYKKKGTRAKATSKVKVKPTNISLHAQLAQPQAVKTWTQTSTNGIFLLNQIADFLCIQFLSFTNFEIALDGNMNYGSKIWQAIRKPELIPYINGKSYEDYESDKRLDGIGLYYSITRKRQVDMTVYFSFKDSTLKLKSYNKSREIETNSFRKRYILNKIGRDCELFRLEITATEKQIRPLINKLYGINREADFIHALTDEYELKRIFEYWIEKLVYFRLGDKAGEKVTIFNL
ncbi:MAG: hypothetical protein PHR83_15010 [Paludibacter sp.]|nr:hypothetical protein [Paludibacter sp.]